MPTILDRLKEALSPDFELEREIAGGGMGIVFIARDPTLDRKVAIKVIRPEQATARAAEKFLREARILANLRHPNVVPVHRAGEADGLFYYVMEYLADATLAQRLASGPLPRNEALKLGRDLLDALESVHDAGVVHRDIKPSNIFLIDNRAVLTDFGISKPSADLDTRSAGEGTIIGTVGYMPPEQAYGKPVTVRTDIYAVAMVLYEAYTGRRWSDSSPDSRPDWSGVPARVVPVLRRALAWEADKRWPDAASFRRALWQTRTLHYKRYKWYATAIAAATLVIGAVVGRYLLGPQKPVHDLAILPFVAEPSSDSVLAERADHLRELTRYHLENFSRTAPFPAVDALVPKQIRALTTIGETELHNLGVQYAGFGIIRATEGSTEIAVVVIDSVGRHTDAGTVRAPTDPFNLERTAHEIGFRIAQVVDPNRTYEGSQALAHRSSEAISAFVSGLRAFKENAFRTAERRFREALDADPNFGLAKFWVANAWRWLLTGEPAPEVNLAELLDRHGATLSERERLLLSAQLASTMSRRYEIYREAIAADPRDAYVAAMYAEELYNRGALIGYPLEFTIDQLGSAVAKDPTFGPILGSLARSHIRVGNRSEAEQAVAAYETMYPEPSSGEGEFDELDPLLLRWALAERFQPPDSMQATRGSMLAQPGMLNALPDASRLAQMVGLSRTQAEIAGSLLSRNLPFSVEKRAGLHESRALGLVALGRVGEAFQHFDTAATLFNTPASHLETLEWRLVGDLTGMPRPPTTADRDVGGELERLLEEPAVRARAMWALGLYALNTGNAQQLQRSIETLETEQADTTAERLGVLLRALQLGSNGRFSQALSASQEVLAYDSAAHGGDPFSRAVLHLKRADWLDSVGRAEAADSARLWYEHFELIRRFSGSAQAAEIDWALSTYAMWLRGASAVSRGDRRNACKLLPRVIELWEESDAEYTLLRDSASTLESELACR